MASFAEDKVDAKSRRRKSLAHAMMLVDSAIANLEGVTNAPSTTDTGGGSPAAMYKRRPSTLGRMGSAEIPSDSTIRRRNSRLQGFTDVVEGESNDHLTSAALVAARKVITSLADRCAASSDGSTRISKFEVAELREGLPSRFEPSSASTAAIVSITSNPLTISLIRSWNFDVFEVS